MIRDTIIYVCYPPHRARPPHRQSPQRLSVLRRPQFIRRGTRRKKLEIVQLWRCTSCKRVFTPGPAALHNKTYPLRMILTALSYYDLGCTLEETKPPV